MRLKQSQKPLPQSKSKRARAAEAQKLYQAALLKHRKTHPKPSPKKQEWDSQKVRQQYQEILDAADKHQRRQNFSAKKEAEFEAIYQAHVKEFPDSLDRPYNNCMYLLSDDFPQ